MLNQVSIIGRMGRDPELRRTQSGVAVLSLSLACERDWKNGQTGERETDWIDVQCWRNTAEYVAKYGAKGRLVAATGRLQVRKWTDKSGNARQTTEIVADNVYFLDRRPDAASPAIPANSGGGYGGYSAPASPGYASYAGGVDVTAEDFNDGDDKDLPF